MGLDEQKMFWEQRLILVLGGISPRKTVSLFLPKVTSMNPRESVRTSMHGNEKKNHGTGQKTDDNKGENLKCIRIKKLKITSVLVTVILIFLGKVKR